MEGEEDIYEKKKLTEEEKNRAWKDVAIFALVAFFLYVMQLVLPGILRAIIHFIKSL